jgi:hypothetical protein
VEFAPDKIIVCVQGDDYLYIIDRVKKQSTKIKTTMSNHFEVCRLPSQFKLPLLIFRDDFHLKILNYQTLKFKTVKDAPYQASKSKIYKTLDLRYNKQYNACEVIYL